MKVLGHRGFAAAVAENTLASFRAAMAAGADGFECDVRAAASGELVVIHDATVDRTTDGTGRVDALTLDALRALDAGYRFSPDGASFPSRGRGMTVPALVEVLDEHPDAEINLELKGMPGEERYDPSEPVARSLGAHLAGRDCSRIVVSSFNPVALAAFRAAAPGVRTGVLTPDWLDAGVGLSLAVEGGHDGCHVHHSRIDEAFVAAAGAAGKYVVAWTVNEPDRAASLRDLGIAAVITDDPAGIVAALR